MAELEVPLFKIYMEFSCENPELALFIGETAFVLDGCERFVFEEISLTSTIT
jgi:hypothetical protein